MPNDTPEILVQDKLGIARAATLLAAGKLVALPTETVYGLAADARSDAACARIFAAKARPRFNPLIVHLASLAQVEALALLPDPARALAAAFWPGPLTMVLPLRAGHGLSPLVTAGLDTVAVRLPAHPVMRAVLETFGAPIAAPSANPSGRISATTLGHVLSGLGGRIDAVLDGADCAVGIESTILAPAPGGTRLLREGGIAREDIVVITGPLITDTTPGAISAPGQMASHYAPVAPVFLNMPLTDRDAVSIGFGSGAAEFNLSPRGDLPEAAANLFRMLHAADAAALGRAIHVAPIPDMGLGRAINDRLHRAAAPRQPQ